MLMDLISRRQGQLKFCVKLVYRFAEKHSVEALSFHLYLQFNRMAEKEELKWFGIKGYFKSTVTKWIYGSPKRVMSIFVLRQTDGELVKGQTLFGNKGSISIYKVNFTSIFHFSCHLAFRCSIQLFFSTILM